MNKKIILSLASALLLTSTLLASGMNSDNQNTMKCSDKNGMKKECSKKMMYKKHHGKNHMVAIMMHLDLSAEQKVKVRELMRNTWKNMPKTSDAFSDSSFDKELFIKLSKERRDNKIQREADMIEGVYNILTPAQKKALKEKLSQKRMKKQKMSK